MAKTDLVLIKRKVKIMNKLGLHARPAAEFVRAANAFRSEVWIVKGPERFSAASIIEVLSANLNCGDVAVIEAHGPDAENAVEKLVKLVCQFGRERHWRPGERSS
jgi:phosphocarrier protein HPr